MKGYYECGKCRHQWGAVSFDSIPCPKCGSTYVARAMVGGRKPEWFNTNPEAAQCAESVERQSQKGKVMIPPVIPKHVNCLPVLVLEVGENSYSEALFCLDGTFRYEFDEDPIEGIEDWLPLPTREIAAMGVTPSEGYPVWTVTGDADNNLKFEGASFTVAPGTYSSHEEAACLALIAMLTKKIKGVRAKAADASNLRVPYVDNPCTHPAGSTYCAWCGWTIERAGPILADAIQIFKDIQRGRGTLLMTSPPKDPWVHNKIDERINACLDKIKELHQ